MIRTRTSLALAMALVGSLALAGCTKDEPAAPPPPIATPAPASTPAAAAAAVTVTSVDLGTGLDAGNRVIAPTTTFATTDAIHASVATSASDPSMAQGLLTARWTYEGGQLVDETSRDFNFNGTGNTAFALENPDGWPTGNYQVEILFDGEVVQTRSFEVH